MAEPGPPAEGDTPAESFAEAQFMAALTGWAAGQRVAGAAASRSRLRALAESAAGTATFTGVLVDLAERRAEVAVTTWPPVLPRSAGPQPGAGARLASRLSGRLSGVGRDFLVLDQPSGRPVLIRLEAVAAVAPAASAGMAGARGAAAGMAGARGAAAGPAAGSGPAGNRRAPLALSLVAVLAELAVERAPVSVSNGSERYEGELIAVGADVVTVQLSRSPRRVVHLPAAALRWCELR